MSMTVCRARTNKPKERARERERERTTRIYNINYPSFDITALEKYRRSDIEFIGRNNSMHFTKGILVKLTVIFSSLVEKRRAVVVLEFTVYTYI